MMANRSGSTMAASPRLIAGVSAPALKRAHLRRLMAFIVSVTVCTFMSWEGLISSWTFRMNPGRIFRDFPSLVVAALCHCLAALSRYLVSDLAAGTEFVPGIPVIAATVLVHGVLGLVTGYCSWDVLLARAAGIILGNFARSLTLWMLGLGTGLLREVTAGPGALGGLMAVGAASSGWYVLFMLNMKRNHMRFDLLNGGILPLLYHEVESGLLLGVMSGGAFAVGYILLRLVGKLVAPSGTGSVLALLLGFPGGGHGADAGAGGMLWEMGCATFLSSALNISLYSFFTSMMQVILTAPQDFARLWDADEAYASQFGGGDNRKGRGKRGPESPAGMLLDILRIGQESVLYQSEREFIEGRASTKSDPMDTNEGPGSAGYNFQGGSASEREDHSEAGVGTWEEEVELQRRALEVSAEKGAPYDDSERVPLWAQISKLQALQSLAREAPSDKTLRASIYDLNIPQVLRALCLEVDSTSLLLQSLAFRRDSTRAASVLGCAGREDMQWLVLRLAPQGSSGDASGRCLKILREGLTLPMQGALDQIVFQPFLRMSRRMMEGSFGRGEGGAMDTPGLSWNRVMSAKWAAEGLTALMERAPGEVRTWNLEPMLPAVLGSLSALVLGVQLCLNEGEAFGEAGHEEEPSKAPLRVLGTAAESALSAVVKKYRSCLPSYRFPVAYAKTINRLCP